MFFHIVGIKEISGKNYNLDFLLESETEEYIREFLGKKGVVILSIEKYIQGIANFGSTQLVIKISENTSLSLIEKSKDYRKTYLLYSLVGLDVKEIHSTDSTESFSEEDMKINIKNWNQELKNLKKTADTSKQTQENHDFKIDDHKITEMQLFASQVIQKSKKILDTMKRDISPQTQKNLDNLTQELLKVKLGTNIEKMRTLSHEIIVMVDSIEKQKINKLETFEQNIFKNSIITNVDVAKEVQKWEKAEEVKQLGGKKTSNDKFYISFGKTGIYLKFLWRDIVDKLQKSSLVFLSFFRLLGIGIYTATILFGLYNVYLFLRNVETNIVFIKILINLGLASSLYLIVAFIAKKRSIWIIIGLLIAVVLYVIFSYLLANTLSF